MRRVNRYGIIVAAAALALVVGATQSRADSCSASTSSLVTRSTGGSCGAALTLNQIFELTYRITNASIIDDALSPNDGDPVQATIHSGEEIDATLAQETSGQGGTELPSVLAMVPTCSPGSSVNAGGDCTVNADCGNGVCGCKTNVAGVTCTAVGPNHVTLHFGQDVVFAPSEEVFIATIRVKTTDLVDPPALCGVFFSRMDSTGDIIETTDAVCDSAVTAGAQASADLHAPECVADSDCGDAECNVCADLGTDNHCAEANIGSACGTDGDPTDCQTPACVDQAGVGVCAQDQVDVPDDTACAGDGVDCTDDVCISGVCEHQVDNAFCDDGDPCTEETCSAVNDCVYNFICEGTNICRSPGYWATHSGYEKDGINVGQLVIDAVGPIEVCGQSITDSSNIDSPFVGGLGLDSDVEGLCVKVKGVKQRQLYRQLVAAALNCGISGGDCETITDPLIDVSFNDCSDVCAGNPPAVDPPTVNDCIGQLDCFNNGGQMINGSCVYDLPGNCHEAVLCNEEIGVCPKQTPASSSSACKEARGNTCTIDDCN